jgi:voltage-gated potassium channel
VELRDQINAFVDRHEISWELTFAALALIFVAVSFIPAEAGSNLAQAISILEWTITGIFAAEFGTRMWAARDRRRYLRGHWIDLAAIVPPIRGARLIRLIRVLRLIRAFVGVARAMTALERFAEHRGLIWLFVAWAAVMLLSSLAVFLAETGTNSAFAQPLDAIWWGIVTMTTVGYGDSAPLTGEGRFAASVLMLLGIVLYSGITATVTSFFLTSGAERSPDIADSLERLVALRNAGDLTVAEYAAAKARVLD